MKCAILLKQEERNAGLVVSNTWYYGAGKYSNSFSTSSHIDGARIFPTMEKAQETLNSEKFQCRLKAANALNRINNFNLYEPTIVEII